MPTVMRVGSLRFFFYAKDHDPPHVHVSMGKNTDYPHLKIDLQSLEVTSVRGFSKSDVGKILKIVKTYQIFLMDYWEDHFHEEE